MAFPFGGHPTLHQYLEWLRSQGFEYKSGIWNFETTFRIEKDGKPLLSVFGELEEYLSPSVVEYFDRRLGVASPFPKTPR